MLLLVLKAARRLHIETPGARRSIGGVRCSGGGGGLEVAQPGAVRVVCECDTEALLAIVACAGRLRLLLLRIHSRFLRHKRRALAARDLPTGPGVGTSGPHSPNEGCGAAGKRRQLVGGWADDADSIVAIDSKVGRLQLAPFGAVAAVLCPTRGVVGKELGRRAAATAQDAAPAEALVAIQVERPLVVLGGFEAIILDKCHQPAAKVARCVGVQLIERGDRLRPNKSPSGRTAAAAGYGGSAALWLLLLRISCVCRCSGGRQKCALQLRVAIQKVFEISLIRCLLLLLRGVVATAAH